ncbi:MAG: transcription antitermination protein transcriptional antiterminator NusG [Candidatus Parcubacteria bacterium]|jgi:transcriptional antiterminator NusG
MAKQELGGEKHWYAVHTYSGYENAVLRNLKQKIISQDLQDRIFNVIVPVEKKIKVKGTKRVEVEEKIYPGYVLVEMIVDDDTWYQVRNTPRVTGFVGSGTTPVPLAKKELDFIFSRMKDTETVHDISVAEGEMVSVTDGPFKDYEGRVAEVDKARGKLKVLVSMFGRETPLELDFLQVKKL